MCTSAADGPTGTDGHRDKAAGKTGSGTQMPKRQYAWMQAQAEETNASKKDRHRHGEQDIATVTGTSIAQMR